MPYEQSTEVAIIGCGPAGIAAAIQLTRSGVDCLVFERERVGGLLLNANLVENYPGFPDGITGADLARLMERHLRGFAVDVIPKEASGLQHTEDGFGLTAGEEAFKSRMVVIATGTKPKSPEGVHIHAAARPKVFTEIVPILKAHDEEIVIVGAGDAAFDYALNLGKRNIVTILNRTENTRCLPLLRERVEALPSVRYLAGIEVVDVAPGPRDRISIRCRSEGRSRVLTADRLVFAIGREPELGALSGALLASQYGLREEGLLYLVGDVTRGDSRQTAIAVGDGVKAAMDICNRLRIQTR